MTSADWPLCWRPTKRPGRPWRRANPELAERIARLTLENDLPYVQENLGPILKSTRQGAKRVSDIVQNLREFARLDQAAIDRVDLNAAIASTLELIRGRLERHQIEVVQNLGEIPPIVCAPAQINQVILNLLLNAQQAIEATGRDGGRIEIGTRANRTEVILEITDDGCGIPAGDPRADLRRVLHHQTRRRRNRTGLEHQPQHRVRSWGSHRAREHARPGVPLPCHPAR